MLSSKRISMDAVHCMTVWGGKRFGGTQTIKPKMAEMAGYAQILLVILGLGTSPTLPEIGSRPRSLLLCRSIHVVQALGSMHSGSFQVHDLVRCIPWCRFSLVTVTGWGHRNSTDSLK